MSLAQSSSVNEFDEQTVLRLQKEWFQHSGFSDQDIAFDKQIMGQHFIQNDGLHKGAHFTPTEWERTAKATRQANPNATAKFDLDDIKVQMFGDTAIVTYTGTFSTSGFKDPLYNYSMHGESADTWQKQDGKWKIVCDWNTPIQPVPPKLYKLTPLTETHQPVKP